VGEDEGVVRDDVGNDVTAAEEELEELDGVFVAGGTDHGRAHGVAGEDGGSDAGGDGGAGDSGGSVEVPRTDEGLDAVVEAEARADEGGGGVGEAGAVGVPRGRRVAAEGMERRLDTETTLAAPALGSGLLGGGEGEVAAPQGVEEPREGWWWWGGDGGGEGRLEVEVEVGEAAEEQETAVDSHVWVVARASLRSKAAAEQEENGVKGWLVRVRPAKMSRLGQYVGRMGLRILEPNRIGQSEEINHEPLDRIA
jgi:hypothetical protein